MGAPQYEQAGADIGGTGTTNTIPRWTGPSTLGDSVITQSGSFIGIGTSSPGAQLHVERAGGATANAEYIRLRNTTNATGSNVSLAFYTSNNAVSTGFISHTTAAGPSYDTTFSNWNGSTAAEVMRIVGSTGNVGIGTASPGARLDVSDTANQLRATVSNSTPAVTTYALGTREGYISARQENSGSFNVFTDIVSSTSQFTPSGLRFFTHASGDASISERARIDSAGSICINTTNARTSRFSVEQTGTGTKLATFSNAVDADFEIKSASAGLLTIGTGTGTLAIQSGGTERMRVSNSGVASASQVAIGTSSFTTGRALTTVADLDVFGVRVGRGSGDQASNTAVGSTAMNLNTTGVQNVALGQEASYWNTTGSQNTSVGNSALRGQSGMTSGSANVAIGYTALQLITTGANNVAIGSTAGQPTTSGSSNVIIGSGASLAAATDSNQFVLGSATNYVATNGGATTYYATAGALLGYMQIRLNGANVKIPVYAP